MRSTLRGTALLGLYLGAFVPVGYRASRARRRHGRAAGMAVIRRHVKRTARLAGVHWQVENAEVLPDGGYVLVHNEASLVDLCVMHGVILHDFAERTIAAAEWTVWPGTRWMNEAMGITPFRRGDRAAADAVLTDLANCVAEGGRVSMSGPGRLSKDGKVQRFKRGGALIAIRAGKPVIPTAIVGGWERMPTGSLRLQPGALTVRFGDPIPTAGLTDEDAPELARRVRSVVEAMYEAGRSLA